MSVDFGCGAAQMIKIYYRDHFPHETACKLLGRSWRGRDLLEFREVAVETHDGVYIRWLSVSTASELRNTLVAKSAVKVHIGAIFDEKPVHRKKVQSIKATQREFIIDIDVDDSTNSGVESSDLKACDAAWCIVAFGMIVVEKILRRKFGFINMLLVYSGRRGAHLSVYDARACELTDEARSAMVSYMQPHNKNTQGNINRPMYGNIMNDAFFGDMWRSHILPFWLKFGLRHRENGGAGFLESAVDKDDFMELLGIDEAKQKINLMGLTSIGAWNMVWEYANNSRFKDVFVEKVKHTVLSYVWPRLDANVSKQRNHLNKSWFSLHPKTGRICIPIIGNPLKFDPSSCPLLDDVVMGKPDTLKIFDAAVAEFKRFLDRLAVAPSEKWEPPRTQVRTPMSYNLVGKKRDHADVDVENYILRDTTRLCYNVHRVYFAQASTADPASVSIFWYTMLMGPTSSDSVSIIYARDSPPFRAPTRFPLQKFKRAIMDATRNPDTEIECGCAYVCVLLNPRNKDMKHAVDRLERMREGLLRPNHAASVNSTWGGESHDVIINTMIKPTWDINHIFIG